MKCCLSSGNDLFSRTSNAILRAKKPNLFSLIVLNFRFGRCWAVVVVVVVVVVDVSVFRLCCAQCVHLLNVCGVFVCEHDDDDHRQHIMKHQHNCIYADSSAHCQLEQKKANNSFDLTWLLSHACICVANTHTIRTYKLELNFKLNVKKRIAYDEKKNNCKLQRTHYYDCSCLLCFS